MAFPKSLSDVVIVRTNENGSSYYDPDTNEIVIMNGWLSRSVRNMIGRSETWLIGHELGHFFLDNCSRAKKKNLQKIFGDLSEEAYCGDSFKEIGVLLMSFDETSFITARSTLCPEEDFAEIVAYIYSSRKKGIDPVSRHKAVQMKLQAVKDIVFREDKE